MMNNISKRFRILRVHYVTPRKFSSYKEGSSAEYCLNLVKSHDYENFLSTVLLKSIARSNAFAVRSFNVEVARVAGQVSQETIGLMRIKFWEDALDKCFAKDFHQVPKHPVALELFKAINRSKLTKRYLKNLISSRKDNLNTTFFNTLEDMETYSEQSVSSIYYLILESCDIQNVHADHAASHLGKSQGLVQQLRTIPLAQRLNFISIPQNILVKNNVSHEQVLRSKDSQSLSDCVYEVASRAHQHLEKSRSLMGKVPEQGRGVFLPAISILSYLDRLQKVDYNVFHPALTRRPWNLLPRIWWAKFANKY